MKIRARQPWNATGITLVHGRRYRLTASGTWTDFFITCDANGFTSDDAPWFSRRTLREKKRQRRAPQENWFMLMDALGHDEATLFPIGVESVIDAEHTGLLTCFANDIRSIYWNNWGAITLDVTEL